MKAIGGYPELELNKGEHYHKDAIRLNTARNCLEYILLARQYSRVYLPYYTCDAVLEPFGKSPLEATQTEFYHIDGNLDPADLPHLSEGEAFLYTNYFGLKQETVARLADIYGSRLIVDNSQAFFDMPYPGVDTFYSARKFFGVPDGAYLCTDSQLTHNDTTLIEQDHSFDRMSALLKRIDLGAERGYSDFQQVESMLSHQPIRRMSKLTEAILCSIDYNDVRARRLDNYNTLSSKLDRRNTLRLRLNEGAVPLCYPFIANSCDIRRNLIAEKIFVPTYWPNVLKDKTASEIERQITNQLLPLPIAHTYSRTDMERIVENIIRISKI